jgi:hypothetical protein
MASNTVSFARSQLLTLIVGVAGLVVGVLLALIGPSNFFQSYLFAYLFWVGLPLGCLVLLLTNHMAGGSWGALIQRPLEAGVSMLPLMALFFIPVLFGLNSIYVWTDAEYVASHPAVEWKAWYLSTWFFIVRAVVYFVTWVLLARYFVSGSRRQDQDPGGSAKIGYRMKSMAGMGIMMYVLTMTLASVDWGMSLTPTWWSGIYGVIFIVSQAITAIAFIIAVMTMLAARDPRVDELLTAKRLQDLGNFMLAFTVFWAYTSIGQLIILWSNNVVETNTWYVLRFGPGWSSVGMFLLFFGFFAPFFILLSRWVKRKRRALVVVSAWAWMVQLLNMFFFIIPTFERSGFALRPLDIVLLIGIGGVLISFYFRSLTSRPLLPANDPRLAQAEGH